MTANQFFPQFFGGKSRGSFKTFFAKGCGQAGLGKVEDAHSSTAQGGHGSDRLVPPGELVVLWFVGQGLAE